MRPAKRYPILLTITIVIVAGLLGVFGLLGYLTFGAGTKQVVTLNLPDNPWTLSVKIGLSVAILFYFAIASRSYY